LTTQYGRLLGGCWKEILEAVSNVDKLFMIKAGGEDQLIMGGSKYMENESNITLIISNAEI